MIENDAEASSLRGAVRFFWLWLVVTTSASITGNVIHAIVNAPNGSGLLSAAVAVVPPVVLLGSTHSVALLVKARRRGTIYWVTIAMTIALAACAFTLSFDALTDLAHSVGMPSDLAWLWPCAIDVSIGQSTLALLVLGGPVAKRHVTPRSGGVGADGAPSAGAEAIEASEREDGADELERWREPARELVSSGVTSKDPAIVARILAEHEAGTPPSTIGRRLAVHHSTVNRILAKAPGARDV